MKKYLAAISATALISVAPFAMAASSVDLTVTGTITPAACDVSLSMSEIDLGNVMVKDLNQDTFTEINNTSMDISLSCNASTLVAINAIDNNPGTSFNNDGYGLGLTDAGEKLGSFTSTFTSVQVDGVTAGAIDSIDNGANWSYTAKLQPARITTVSTLAGPVPLAAENIRMGVDVSTLIAPKKDLTLTGDVTIRGSMTAQVFYL